MRSGLAARGTCRLFAAVGLIIAVACSDSRNRRSPAMLSLSFGILGLTALAQLVIFVLTSSVALLADLVHNSGDALTAIPLGIAFFLRSFRAEKIAGLAVVLAIFISACVALYETLQRFVNPEDLTHLWVLAAAGLIGFAGNEVAAHVRLRAGRRLSSPALIADGNHARTDGIVSLGVVASAILVALGFPFGDPLVGLGITLVIFKITWDSWRLISTTDPGELLDEAVRVMTTLNASARAGASSVTSCVPMV
jgi:cation diffusion facilitator family transporter